MIDFYCADFYVTHIRRDPETRQVNQITVRESFGNSLSAEFRSMRDEMIIAIEEGAIVELVAEDRSVEPRRLFAVEVNGQKYLRTDLRPIPSDEWDVVLEELGDGGAIRLFP